MSIVVTGATGHLGRHVVEQLLEKVPADQITAVVRTPEKAADFAERGVKIAVADYNTPGTFDTVFAAGDKVLLISGFPQTRRSWNRLIPLLSQKFETIPADLPSFGDSGFLAAPATTENVGKVFHAFVDGLGAPLHVVAHDFGAWCAYSWALQFPQDFKSLTLIDAGIPGVTLTNDIELSDYKRKWNFKQERSRLSATKLKRPRAKWLRPRRRSGSLLRRRTRNRRTRGKPPASRFPTDRPSACWDCWLQGRP